MGKECSYNPAFKITNNVMNLLTEITEIVGEITILEKTNPDFVIKYKNRIETICLMFKNEIKDLTLEKVSNIVKGNSSELSFENIEKRYAELSQQHNVLVTVETMEYLYAGGRLTKAQFVLSNLLNILPIITIKDGVLAVSGKHRGMNKVLSKMCEEIKEKNPKSLFVLYTTDELLEKAMSSIKKTFGDIEVETEIVSPVIGSHAGPKAIAIGYLGYDK